LSGACAWLWRGLLLEDMPRFDAPLLEGGTMPARGLRRPVQHLLPGEGTLYHACKDKAFARPLLAVSRVVSLANPSSTPAINQKRALLPLYRGYAC